MNQILFFEPLLKNTSKVISLNAEESHHLTRVLRLKINDEVLVCNGKGIISKTKIISILKNNVNLEITESKEHTKPQPIIHLAFSPLKKRIKNEWIVEKSTELGVSSISFFQSKHSERVNVNNERMRKVVISAVKQSLNPFKPLINELQNFESLIKNYNDTKYLKLIAYCGTSEKEHFSKYIKKGNKEVVLIIGAEGGFSEEEINFAKSNDFITVNLGKLRLRSETAALSMLSGILALAQK